MIFLNFSLYYVYDFPQLFENELISSFNIDPLKVNLLYTVYSIPNFVIAPLFSMLLGYTTLGFGSLLLQIFIFFSTVMVYFAVELNNYYLLMTARAILGMGGEVLIIAFASMAERWFTGKFLSLAIGLGMVASPLGGAIAAWLSPEIFVKMRDIKWVVFVMAVVCFLTWALNVGYMVLEDKFIENEKDNQRALREYQSQLKVLESAEEQGESPKSKSVSSDQEAKFTFKHVKHLEKLFWLISLVFIFVSQSYYQFTNFANDFLMKRYHYTYIEAKNIFSIVPITTMILIPIFSSIVVVVGKKGILMVVCSIMAVGTYWFLETLPAEKSPLVTVAFFGISIFFALYSSIIWSSFTLVMP